MALKKALKKTVKSETIKKTKKVVKKPIKTVLTCGCAMKATKLPKKSKTAKGSKKS